MLAGLMEVDPGKSMNFDQFFQLADDILEREVLCIFSTTSARHFRLYLKKDCKYVPIFIFKNFISYDQSKFTTSLVERKH